jgi:eukaryotic-like serine/threonine-protein kinase
MALANRIRFGVYELDADAMELRRQGLPIRLQEQPLRVLVFLATRPGELVTREELRGWIWGDTFVDFDQSLNKAINRAREALRDDPAAPQYIETVPRRGYRFIAPVTVIPGIEGPAPAINLQPTPALDTESSIPAQPSANKPGKRVVMLAACAIILLAGLPFILTRQRSGKVSLQEAPHLALYGWQPTLSQDGKLVAYLSAKGSGPFHIWVRQTAGGEAMPVTSGNDPDYLPSFSPDGTQIVFCSARSGGGLFVTPTIPGESRVLVANPGAIWPSFSPSGNSVLFSQDQKAFLVSPSGGQPRPLPIDKEFRINGPVHWSPDGKEILFHGGRVQDKGTSNAWWIVPLGEREPRRVRLPGIQENSSSDLDVSAWVRSADDRDWIIYKTSDEDSWHLWRIQVSSQGQPVDTKPQLLTEGTGGLGLIASAARDGSITYAVGSARESIFEIPLNDHVQKAGPIENIILNEARRARSPSLSRDGRWMAYDSVAPGKPDSIQLRDLTTRTDHLLDDGGRQPGGYYGTSISPDGSSIAFTRDCKQASSSDGSPLDCGFVVSAQNGAPEQICEGCTPRGFSSDGSLVMLEKDDVRDGDRGTLAAFDLKLRKERAIFRSPPSHEWLYHPYLSWDDHWLAFRKTQSQGHDPSQILIAPVRDGYAADASAWIPITDGLHNDDKPQFSADGDTVFYTSSRDGYLCIWAQPLDPRTKHPVGPPYGFEHFHDETGQTGIVTQTDADLAVARDKMLIALWLGGLAHIWVMKTE